MNEIGIKLKEKREENGVSVEEAAEDLKLRPSQITSIEEGKKEDFKDIILLKSMIKDYSKYLGLDSEEIIDQFNEYLFDYTSKIPLEVIEKAKEEKKDEVKEFVSPYTNVKKDNNTFKIILICVVILVIGVVGFLIFNSKQNSSKINDNVTYAIRR